MSCIAGIAQNGESSFKTEIEPTVVEEIVSLIIVTVKKIYQKMFAV